MNPYDTIVSLPPEPKIDHELTDVVVCPHCGYKFRDSWEFRDAQEVDWCECGKSFFMVRNTTVTYSTRKE